MVHDRVESHRNSLRSTWKKRGVTGETGPFERELLRWPQLRSTCWGEQLFVPPVLEALLRLLELERQSCKW